MLKVYYVDDEADLCEGFADCVARPGIQVLTFSDAHEALRQIEKVPPDVLFLDYRMPNITGDDVAAQVDKNIPKVLITGDPDVKTKEKFYRVLPKPVPWDEVLRILSTFEAAGPLAVKRL